MTQSTLMTKCTGYVDVSVYSSRLDSTYRYSTLTRNPKPETAYSPTPSTVVV